MSATASRPKVRPLDPLDLDGLLSDEDRMIAETVRRFAADRVVPHVDEWYEQGTLPTRELAPAIGELGLLGMHLSGYGCAGRARRATGSPAGSSRRPTAACGASSRSRARWRCSRSGRSAARSRRSGGCRGMAAGEVIGCFGLTEPDSGSDPSSCGRPRKRDGSDWVLNGAKMWITNGGIADVAVVWAKTDDGIRGFVVPTRHAGLHARRTSSASSRCARR